MRAVPASKCRQIWLRVDRDLILKRLKDEEYVETYSVESEGRPARKYYHLTQKGLEYQQALCGEWKEFTAAVDRLIG